MNRSLRVFAVLFLIATNLGLAQNHKSIEARYPLRPEFEYQAAKVLRGANTIAQTDETALQNGGDWLLTQQFPSGAYPSTVGQPPSTDSQGTTARGMLAAYQAVHDADHFASAVRCGDYLVNSYPRQFSDGDPDMLSFDVLFLEELALLSGDGQYADFVQTNFWNKLAAGTYGEANDQDAQAWAENIPIYAEYPWEALETAFLSAGVIAAQYTNEAAIRTTFMNVLLAKLEALSTTDIDGDLHALSGAIMASAHTGIDLNPQSGRWASANSTQDLVNTLAGYQRSGGDWPYDSSLRASRYVGDVSVTTWACMALKAWNAQTYATHLGNGLAFIKSLQQADGQILTNPGWSSTTETGVQVHAVALVALGANDGVLLNDTNNPANQAPVAQNGNASTNEDTPVAITLQASDADNNPLTYSIVTNPTQGTLNGTAPNLTYTPNANANGNDSLAFRAHDGQAHSNTAAISITVNAINDAPVANNQSASTNVNTAKAITLTAGDVDNASLNYIIVTSPGHGTLSAQSGVTVTYTPATGYTGSDNFTFQANDGQYESNVATVSLTVNAINANLALNKPATASSTSNGYPATHAVDGNTANYWRSGSVSSTTIVWLRVDLQAAQNLGRAVVRWYDKYHAKNFQVQISNDDVNWSTVYTDNAGNGGIDDFSFASVSARYVRVYITKNNKSSERIAEFEIYAPANSLPRQSARETLAALPSALELDQNYPNPFNPATTIRFRLAEPHHIMLKVYNPLGQQVALLLNETRLAGEHSVRFNAVGLSSGLYFAVLQFGEERRVLQLQLLK